MSLAFMLRAGCEREAARSHDLHKIVRLVRSCDARVSYLV